MTQPVDISDAVRAVVVHYRTPDLLERAVSSWFAAYPEVPLTIVDNDPDPASDRTLQSLLQAFDRIAYLSCPENVGHGPGMDLAIRHASEEFLFCLDSDTEVERDGYLEEMVPAFEDPDLYGIGRVVTINRRGFNVDERAGAFLALDPAYMLIRRAIYLTLPPFIQHGQPVVENFREAGDRGLRLESFPIGDYIRHDHRGTVERHGYGLGIRGKINYLLNKLGL